MGLSELFCRLHDADKSARYAARAYDLSRSLQLGDLNSRHHRAALLQMAAALRKKGELGDAHDYCSVCFHLAIKIEPNLNDRTRAHALLPPKDQLLYCTCIALYCIVPSIFYLIANRTQEATRLSLVSGDQASYARSIRIMGDIYRKKSDINVSRSKFAREKR